MSVSFFSRFFFSSAAGFFFRDFLKFPRENLLCFTARKVKKSWIHESSSAKDACWAKLCPIGCAAVGKSSLAVWLNSGLIRDRPEMVLYLVMRSIVLSLDGSQVGGFFQQRDALRRP